jgi:sugar O-acyltransferase (sialic acid O-acetyltransferase NeuD family)
MDKYLIWGGGGHGKVVADVARSAGMGVAGFVDSDSAKLDFVVEPGGARVTVAESEFVNSLSNGKLPPGVAGVLLAIGSNEDRARCRARLKPSMLATAVHPRAIVDKSARIGPGSVVMGGAVINSEAVLGAGVIVNSGAVVEHDCLIGDDTHIAPGAVIAGRVRIGERVLVGAGSVIIPGVTIGSNTVIGAGSVVIMDVAANSRVAGNPAKAIKS